MANFGFSFERFGYVADRSSKTACACVVALVTMVSNAIGGTLTAVYPFPAGQNPFCGLTVGASGNLFGTTSGSGAGNSGTVFQVTPTGDLVWTISLNSRTLGSTPCGPLLLAKDGAFYGTTSTGGANQRGTLFRVTPEGTLETFYAFSGPDGAAPFGGLIQLSNGLFYGTTSSGGTSGAGSVFRMSTNRVVSNVFSFGVTNGSNPYSGLVLGRDGKLYGVTQYGGTYGYGSIFQIGTSNAFTSMVSFRGDNGANPKAMILGRDGNFYGVTLGGGPNDLGTVFKFSPPSTLTMVGAFNGANGSHPSAPLFQAPNGQFFGTAQFGGANNVGTVFTVTSSGISLFSSFSLSENGGFPTSALVQANDGNLYGTTSTGGSLNGGTIFRISDIAPVITTRPVSVTNRMGSNVIFTVTAKGSIPLQYQWAKGTNVLTDGINISGTTSPTLVISNISGTDAGKYTVTVSNSAGVAQASASLTVKVDATILITSPGANKRGTNFVISGKASDTLHPFQVFAWVTNINNGATTVSDPIVVATDADRWTFTPALLPGTNIVAVQTRNSLNNNSAIATRTLFFTQSSPLSLNTNGNGTVVAAPAIAGGARPTNGALLNIGQGYRVVARPGRNFVFTNWSGDISSANPSLTFIMQPGLTLTANFVTNGFINMAGIYSGLVQEPGQARVESSGRITSFKINSNGSYSGRLTLQRVNYTLSGSFDVSGSTTQQIIRPQDTLTLQMQLNFGSSPRALTGTLTSSNWAAEINAWAAISDRSSTTATMLIQPGETGVGPTGFGYAAATGRNGILTLTGHLADGTALVDSQRISENGEFPLYLSLYHKTGMLIGTLNISNGVPSGTVAWINGSTNTGFTNALPVVGSTWTAPSKGAFVELANLTLQITGGGLTNVLTYVINVDKNRVQVQSGSTNSLSGKIDPKSGVLSLTFGTGAGKSTAPAFGAMLKDSSTGGGYFVRGTNYGSFSITP